jgi:uncharacterized protein (UPF0333 family)
LNSSTKGQISIELYAALSAVLLLFLASLLFTMQIRSSEESRQIRTASLMLAQRIANSADLMQRNLCNGRNCSISLILPSKIRGVSFSKEVDYNVSFNSNWVVVMPEGYPTVSIAASIPLEGLQISIEQSEGGKLLKMEGNG